MKTNPHQPLHAKTREDINMEEGADLESKYDENELTWINLENIMETYRKQGYSIVPLEQISKVHKYFLSSQVGEVVRTKLNLGVAQGSNKPTKKVARKTRKMDKNVLSSCLKILDTWWST